MRSSIWLLSFVVATGVVGQKNLVSSRSYLQTFFPNVILKSDPHTRVYGGSAALDGQFPFMVFMMYAIDQRTTTSCSASLLASDWVLLAAHCFQSSEIRPERTFLVAGKSDLAEYKQIRQATSLDKAIDESALRLQERMAKEIFTHPQFNVPENSYQHDLALIRTKTPFILSNTVRPLPFSRTMMTVSKTCTILGWGLSENNVRTYALGFVKSIKAKLLSTEGCTYKTSGSFICLEKTNQGICKGDSGSPLVCEDQIWGVASHLIGTSPDCGSDMEEYYSELYADIDWIDQIVNVQPKSPNYANKSTQNFVLFGFTLIIYNFNFIY